MSQDLEKSLLEEQGNFSTIHAKDSESDKTAVTEADESESQLQIYKKIFLSVLNMSVAFILNGITNNFFLILLNNQEPAVQGAVSLSFSVMNIFGAAVFISMNVGLMNRFSHVYGAKDFKLMGLYIHRALIINLFTVMTCMVTVYFSPELLSNFGYDEVMLENMRIFIPVAMLMFPFIAILQIYRSYLNALSLFGVSTVIQIIGSLLSIPIAYLLIITLDTGILGVAYIMIIQQFLLAIMTFGYCYIKNPVEESLFKFEKDSYKGLWELTKYMFTAGGQIFIEWIGFEIMNLLSGTLIVQQCDALILAFFFYFMLAGVMVACNTSASTFVGKYMGAGQVSVAKKYTKASLFISLGFAILINCIMLIFTGDAVYIYTDDSEVADYMKIIFKALMVILPFDTLNYMLAGIARAIKKEGQSAIICFVNTYIIAIPMEVILVFVVGFQFYGILLGYLTYCFLSGFCFLYLCVSSDWEKQAEIIAKTIENDQNKLEKKAERTDSEIKGISSDE